MPAPPDQGSAPGWRAIVVGGGISGATVSLLLGRRGYRVMLVERLPTWSVLGSGISLVFPATRALQRIGLLEDCLRAGQVVPRIRICDLDSQPLEEVVMSPPNGESVPGLLGMMRPKLHEILSSAALAEGLEVKLGTTLRTVRQDDDGVEVETSDGGRERCDLLVAADGLHSRTRELIFGPLNPPSFRHQAIFRAVIPKPRAIDAHYQFRGDTGAHSGITPTGPESAYMFCLIPSEDRTRPSAEDQANLMRSHLADLTGLGADLRDSVVDPGTVDYRPLETFLLPRPWNRGRAVVIGDAAHGTTPHLGAGALCFEDAIALDEELERSDDIPQALDRFTERRFERCRFVAEASIKLSENEMHGDLEVHRELYPKAIATMAEDF